MGHKVRASYLYSARAGVGALTGDPAFGRALDRARQPMTYAPAGSPVVRC